MQLLPILLAATVLAASGGLTIDWRGDGPADWEAMAVACGPVILVLAGLGSLVWICCRRVDRGRGAGPIMVAERLARWSRWFIAIVHVLAVVVFGWLDVVRRAIGDYILVDELVTMAPAIVGIIGTWWLYYPIEKRIRTAMLIRQLDSGAPVTPQTTRLGWTSMQARMGLFLLLVPLLIIMALAEIIEWAGGLLPASPLSGWAAEAATTFAALGVFLCTPLLARILLHLTPLRAGPLRDDLLEICRLNRVRVRDVLLWRTSGSMINAAVMGLLGRLRFVLLTDALLDTLSRREVQAVMAHEIGHVRKHHMPWLLACLLASVAVAEMVIEGPFYLLDRAGVNPPADIAQWIGPGATILALLAALQVFGWVSRRFERQADAFAVQYLSLHPASVTAESEKEAILPAETVTAEASAALQGALGRIAHLNAVNLKRRSWRHGSIASRQQHLQSIIGRPLGCLAVDRIVRRIKIATLLTLLASAGVAVIQASRML